MPDNLHSPAVAEHTVNIRLTAYPFIPFRDSLQPAPFFWCEMA